MCRACTHSAWLSRVAELPSFQLRMDAALTQRITADRAALEKRIQALREAKAAASVKEEEAVYEAKQVSYHEMVAGTGYETRCSLMIIYHSSAAPHLLHSFCLTCGHGTSYTKTATSPAVCLFGSVVHIPCHALCSAGTG